MYVADRIDRLIVRGLNIIVLPFTLYPTGINVCTSEKTKKSQCNIPQSYLHVRPPFHLPPSTFHPYLTSRNKKEPQSLTIPHVYISQPLICVDQIPANLETCINIFLTEPADVGWESRLRLYRSSSNCHHAMYDVRALFPTATIIVIHHPQDTAEAIIT